MKNLFITAAFSLLTGCAAQPENVPALQIKGMAHGTCSEETAEVAALSKAQRTAANADAVGVFLIGLPTASMTGGDVENQLALAKGRMQAACNG